MRKIVYLVLLSVIGASAYLTGSTEFLWNARADIAEQATWPRVHTLLSVLGAAGGTIWGLCLLARGTAGAFRGIDRAVVRSWEWLTTREPVPEPMRSLTFRKIMEALNSDVEVIRVALGNVQPFGTSPFPAGSGHHLTAGGYLVRMDAKGEIVYVATSGRKDCGPFLDAVEKLIVRDKARELIEPWEQCRRAHEEYEVVSSAETASSNSECGSGDQPESWRKHPIDRGVDRLLANPNGEKK